MGIRLRLNGGSFISSAWMVIGERCDSGGEVSFLKNAPSGYGTWVTA